MNITFTEDRPIFLQIAEGIEDAILSGAFPEESQVPSITEFSVSYRINPATALKGINLLVDHNILYKKRGVGMFVATGAVKLLKETRKSDFCSAYVDRLVEEASRLGIGSEELCDMIRKNYGQH